MPTRTQIVEKVASLKRLATDQAGQPEGEVAAKMAANIMEKYHISESEVNDILNPPQPRTQEPCPHEPFSPGWSGTPHTQEEVGFDDAEWFNFLVSLEEHLKKNKSLQSAVETIAEGVFGSLGTSMGNLFASFFKTPSQDTDSDER